MSHRIEQNSVHTLCVLPDHQGTRADMYLALMFPDYSRSFLKKLFEQDAVSINEKPIKPSLKLKKEQEITVTFPSLSKERIVPTDAAQLPITIIAQEEDFFIIHKPAGILVHPPDTTCTESCVSDWIVAHDKKLAHIGVIDRPGIVHRLDRNTSGLMIIPRTNKAHATFTDMFKNRTIHKTYLALVHGHPTEQGSITYAIGRHPSDRNKMYHYPEQTTHTTVRQSHSEYKVVRYFKEHALVQIHPKTGRTHQIRVHMKAVGHPLVGDELYGTKSKFLPRHALHAHQLTFMYNNTSYTFESPLEKDIQSFITKHTRSL